MQNRGGGSFTYTAEPHSAPRKLYSQTEPEMRNPLPLLSDPRVIRGNTYSLARKVANARVNPGSSNVPGRSSSGNNHSGGYKKDAILSSSSSQQDKNVNPFYTFTSKPFATDNMDLSIFLIDERDSAVVRSTEQETQADDLIPLPPRQPYVPRKTGVDNETQITTEDTKDLFDFDIESAPLVTLITEKTLEQALIEINAEAELAAILAGIEDCEKQRASEIKWIQEQEEMMVLAQKKVLAGVADVRHRLSLQRSTKRSIAGLQMIRQILPDSIKFTVEQWPTADHIVTAQETVPALIQQAAANVALYQASSAVMEELAVAAAASFEESDIVPLRIPFSLNKLTVRFVKEVEVMPTAPEPTLAAAVISEVTDGDEGDNPAVAADQPAESEEEVKRKLIMELQVVTQLSIPIEPQDSALSLERKVSSFLRQLVVAQQQLEERQAELAEAAAAEGTAAPPAASSLVPAVPLPVRVDIYGPLSAIIAGLYSRQGLSEVPLARDAQLSFFPIDMETLTVDVNLQPAE
jgi:hypothetical protein